MSAYVAGVDIGSTFSKIVILDEQAVLVAQSVIPSIGSYRILAEKVLEEGLSRSGLKSEDLVRIVSTGIGASSVPYPHQPITEIACVGKGVSTFFPSARTVIEVGGQSSWIIRLTEKGKAADFVTSEKCAAGSGRFLQVIARVLQIKLEDIGELSLKSRQRVTFTTSCAVFAESEAVSRVAEGAKKEDILAGVHYSIATKIAALAGRVKLEKDCVMIGGGAKDIGLVKSIEDILKVRLLIPEEPRTAIALGAALLACEQYFEKTDSKRVKSGNTQMNNISD
jgi:(R)-2-hydroxyacyl-CoA dehydratese activating ATPase